MASQDGSGALRKGRRDMCTDLEISIRNFSELEAQGVIVPVERGRGGRGSVYDALETMKVFLRHVRQEHPGGGEREARMRRDLATARLAEQLHRKREGDSLEKSDVAAVWSSIFLAIRSTALRLPRSVAAACAAASTPDEVERLLTAEVRTMLTELSRWQPPADHPTTPPAPTARRTRRAR
jgi:phage terminase Nu1 subunit (DNA packaging protein)